MKQLRSALFVVLSLIGHAFASDTETFDVSASEGVLMHEHASQVLTIAYERANLPLMIRVIPGQRALALVNSGLIDGDVARIRAIVETYPNLIIVPTPITHFTAYAYGRDSAIKVNSWEDLKGYRIGVMRGIQYAKNGTEGTKREFFNSYEKMLDMLLMDRIDIIIAGEYEVAHILSSKLAGKGIHKLGDGLFHAPLYHVLHKSHADLVTQINDELLKMKQTGELEKLNALFLKSIK